MLRLLCLLKYFTAPIGKLIKSNDYHVLLLQSGDHEVSECDDYFFLFSCFQASNQLGHLLQLQFRIGTKKEHFFYFVWLSKSKKPERRAK